MLQTLKSMRAALKEHGLLLWKSMSVLLGVKLTRTAPQQKAAHALPSCSAAHCWPACPQTMLSPRTCPSRFPLTMTSCKRSCNLHTKKWVCLCHNKHQHINIWPTKALHLDKRSLTSYQPQSPVH